MRNNKLFLETLVILLFGVMISCQKDEPVVYEVPDLAWENPADITEGTHLSFTYQLNARSDVAGIYIYTPSVGAQLGVGNDQVLTVDFYPKDDGYVYKVTKKVKINVIPSSKPINGLTTAVFNNSKSYGTMTDPDGNVYKTITIGTQTWMAENLRTTKFRDGSDIPNVAFGLWCTGKEEAYCSYNNTVDPVSIATYGRLYSWYTVTSSRSIAPAGWHVPSAAEWTTLINYLGGESVAGGKMKETTTNHWITPNAGATNESGFTGLPTGRRGSNGADPEPFFSYGNACCFYWSSTDPGLDYGIGDCCSLISDDAGVCIQQQTKSQGFAVRLVKD
ncbi:MAG: fibrobacter succinogenes major paralogous domain-containing protein [Bacteroidales bacterium]|nr:fibrobacter succinogenes major paralogous domain-containing protein [Bacteroidales bacterium]